MLKYGILAGLLLAAGLGGAAQAAPAEYVRVCTLHGAGSFYVPGTNNCLDARTLARLPSITRGLQRGVAAATALTAPPMPSEVGRTTYSVNGGAFGSAGGMGVSLSHRVDLLNRPMSVNVGFGSAGGGANLGRAGVAGEF